MRPAPFLFLLAAIACGGKTPTSGSTSDSGSAARPAPGTSACEDQPSQTCTLCSDDMFRCSAGGAGTSFAACSGAGTCGTGTPPCVNCEAEAFCTGILNPGGDNDVETTSVTITCQ
jgi:hypothetical protein